MGSENFIAFISVSGFFTALLFGILNTNDAEEFLSLIFGISIFFLFVRSLNSIIFCAIYRAKKRLFDEK